MNFSAPNIKDLKITNTTAQMPIAEWQKVCLRLTKLEQKEKLAKKIRAGLEDIKKGNVFPIEKILK